MKTYLVIILLLIVQVSFGKQIVKKVEEDKFTKEKIDGVYIPKDLKDCFKQIDTFWDKKMKTQVKSWTESEFSAKAHFGFGMWMRNNWKLWGGSRLSKYFNNLGIYHPDDMSGIILDSYHRYLTGKKIKLDEQVGYYKAYWQVNKTPKEKDYPKGVKNLEFNTRMGYKLKKNNYRGAIHVQTNSKTDKVWIYDYHFGWKQITKAQLKELEKPKTREKILRKLFKKK